MRRKLLVLMLMAAMALPTGCATHGDPPAPTGPGWSTPKNTRGGASAGWPFWPTRMRVHPSTRIVKEDQSDDHWVIETRIEFADSEGATTKAVGQLTIQLWDGAAAGAAQSLHTWNMDLRDLAVNRRQYDDVMRTYLFRLEIDPASLPESPELRTYFVAMDGQDLEARMHIRR